MLKNWEIHIVKMFDWLPTPEQPKATQSERRLYCTLFLRWLGCRLYMILDMSMLLLQIYPIHYG